MLVLAVSLLGVLIGLVLPIAQRETMMATDAENTRRNNQ